MACAPRRRRLAVRPLRPSRSCRRHRHRLRVRHRPGHHLGRNCAASNGTLVSLGFAVFLGWDHLSTLLLAIGGSITVVVVTSALATILGTWNIPTFTAPFCIIASVMTITAPSFSRVWHTGPDLAALPGAANGTTVLDWGQL